MSLALCPVTLREANAFIQIHHRHHKAVPGAKFAIAATHGDDIVGVVVVGRPVARGFDDGWTLEVNRLCTNGHKNACSMLYGAAWRAGRAMGYRRIVTYTLPEEGGASLRAAGWRVLGERGGGSWSCKSRPRVDTHPLQTKLLVVGTRPLLDQLLLFTKGLCPWTRVSILERNPPHIWHLVFSGSPATDLIRALYTDGDPVLYRKAAIARQLMQHAKC